MEKARIEAERIVRDDFIIEAYDILELMCELVRDNVKAIEAEETCPYDLMEAVSTLLYASTRTEISELSVVKKQFTIKYGKDFVEGAMNNRGGVVNERVLHRMSGQRPNAFLVLSYMKEVAKANNVEWEPDEITAESGERFDAPMVGPDGSSIMPGAGSGLGTAAYQVTDGRIAQPGASLAQDVARFQSINNAIIDNSKPKTVESARVLPPEPPKEAPAATQGDELDLDSLTARFQAFKEGRQNDEAGTSGGNEQGGAPSGKRGDDVEFEIPMAPTHEVTEDATDNQQRGDVGKAVGGKAMATGEDHEAVPKYDELLSRFAKLKSNN